MLETLTLKQHLEETRKELSQALYQHDAACRVIARLLRERDELRALLATQQNAAATAAVEMAGEAKVAVASNGVATGIDDALKARIQEKSAELRKGRKKRKSAEEVDLAGALSNWKVTKSVTLHSSSKPGVTALDVNLSSPRKIATGGMDKLLYLYDTLEDTILATGKGHSKRITGVRFYPSAAKNLLLSSSADKSVRLWELPSETGPEASIVEKYKLSTHRMEVVGVSFHPLLDYCASASLDRTWAFWDLTEGSLLAKVNDESAAGGFTCVDFHPDGMLLVTGTSDHLVKVWDINTLSSAASFEGHSAAVTSIALSESGYHLASAALDGEVRIWDLRKQKCIKSLTPAPRSEGGITSTAFDPSGKVLVAGHANGVAAFHVKGAAEEPVVTFEENSAPVTALRWGPNAAYLAASSMDRSVKLYGAE